MKPKKIIITRSNPVAPDSRVEKTATILAEAGHSITILAWDRSGTKPKVEKFPHYTIIRARIPATFGGGLGQIHKTLTFWSWLFIKLLFASYDAVHACDFDTALPAFAAAVLRGKQRTFDIFDMYSQGGNVPDRLRPLIIRAEHFVMRRARHIIVVDKNRLRDIPEALASKVLIAYNTPPDVFTQHTQTRNNTVMRVVYAGQLNQGRYILEMIQAVSTLPQVELYIAGFGSPEWETQVKTACSATKNCFWLGKRSYEEALKLEASADVLFALYDTSIPQNRKASSNKLFEALMLAKPIIVAADTSMDVIVAELECGYVLDTVNVETLRQVLTEIATHPEQAAQRGKNGRKAYTDEYSFDVMRKRLQSIYI